MIIDGHAHACGSYNGVESIEKYLIQHKIDKVVLCGGEPNSKKDYSYPMMSNLFTGEKLGYIFNRIIRKVTALHNLSQQIDEQNQFVYEISKELPNQVANVYWINPVEEDCMEKMQKFYKTKGFKLIKMHQCWTSFSLDCDNCHSIFQWAKMQNIPVFIHLVSRKQVEIFAEIANQYSDTYFIIAHMIGADYLSEKIKKDNVYWDLSAPQLYSIRILKKILNKYGAKKLLLGSDTPYGKNNIESVIKRLNKLGISKDDMEAISYKNIVKLMRF